MLTVLLILNSISVVVSATSYEVKDIAAGAQSVSVIFTEDIETAGVTVESLDITLTTDDGVAFPYTTSINGDTLTIIPTEEFTRDTESYLFTVADETRTIKVQTLWEPDFKVENDAVTGLKCVADSGYRAAIDVVDENSANQAYKWFKEKGIKELIINTKTDVEIINSLKNTYKLTITITDNIDDSDNYKSIYENIDNIIYIKGIKHLIHYLTNE